MYVYYLGNPPPTIVDLSFLCTSVWSRIKINITGGFFDKRHFVLIFVTEREKINNKTTTTITTTIIIIIIIHVTIFTELSSWLRAMARVHRFT